MSSLRDCLAVTHKRPAFRRKTWERRSKGRRGLSQERKIERGGAETETEGASETQQRLFWEGAGTEPRTQLSYVE